MTSPGDVPDDILGRLRPICLGLPEAYEEPAWVGTRWRIRKRTFAHVLVVDPAHQATYARAVGTSGPLCVVTFRVPGDEIAALLAGGHPFHRASWGVDVVVMVLDDDADWQEITELVTDSYRVLAPKRLAAQLD
ncbi:MmcQ/YjbR family DNA-binding protein [Dactylosporangium sp. NBC_01737]|uniref:MmcQ/YjbR family DNA-binding protein n=1 Tax=Dactylosporangium sp. NBC_01737 TaxID=2975959 RepID=UPI002E116777|nr:MmcQ/YjbR family DNA-binding protein [Dactylosporangium sp. NBC_01737]